MKEGGCWTILVSDKIESNIEVNDKNVSPPEFILHNFPMPHFDNSDYLTIVYLSLNSSD